MKKSEVMDWARQQLNGQEPDLNNKTINKIMCGDIKSVFLKPRKPGFFLPDGSFVEAFNFKLEFGADLDEVENKIDQEERSNIWADSENSLFNKDILNNGTDVLQKMWEHGSRIQRFAEENNTSSALLLRVLDQRKDKNGYSRHAHQTCLDFYRWKPDLQQDDELLNWSWERIDDVLRFSKFNGIRDHLEKLLKTTSLRHVRDDQLSRLLGIKRRKQDEKVSREELDELVKFRQSIKNEEFLTEMNINLSISIVQGKSNPV